MSAQLELVQLPHHAVATQTGIQLPAGLTIDQWEEVGKGLCQLHHWEHWARGQWLAFGTDRWAKDDETVATRPELAELRDRFNMAIRNFRVSEDILQEELMVCLQFPDGNKYPNLTWEHHRVCVVEEELLRRDALAFLKRANDEHWSESELRKAIRQKGRELKEANEPRFDLPLQNVWARYNELARAIKGVGAEELSRLDPDTKAAWRPKIDAAIRDLKGLLESL